MSIETIFNIVLGLVTTGFWFWMRNLREDLLALKERNEVLKDDLHKVRLEYQTEAAAKENQRSIMEMLRDINQKLERIRDQLNQKADK